MQISSILDIIDGSLINSPSISFIYSIKTNVSKVKEGDLFLARNLDEIQQAIKNGAFAIIVDTNTAIIDNEIAWIKVQDMDLCIIKLLRFKLAVKNLEAYHCDHVQGYYFSRPIDESHLEVLLTEMATKQRR